MALEAVYEQEFLDCSFGFRPARSAHDALHALWQATMNVGGGWVYEADIEKFFDTVDHTKLREVTRHSLAAGLLSERKLLTHILPRS